MAKYLVVANVTAESPSLRDEVAGIVRHDPEAAFVVLVPMRPIPAVAEFVAGEDERPVALGWRRALRARRRLESVGARYVSVRLGRGDPWRRSRRRSETSHSTVCSSPHCHIQSRTGSASISSGNSLGGTLG
jgi:hypothetical protein